MNLAKKKRVVDEELLETVRGLPCLCCFPVENYESHAHHVTTRGAGGGDTWDNVMPLCRIHHNEWHLNPGKAITNYPVLETWLTMANRQDVLRRYKKA